MSQPDSLEFNWKHKLCLVTFIPLMMLGLLEGACRLLNTEEILSPDNQMVNLEMPTWMLKDQNQLLREGNMKEQRGNIDWFNMFEEGDGFRVRLIPDSERRVSNNFSLIDYDRRQKYYIKANSTGFRGEEISPAKPANTYRILIFGDSSSFGWGVDQSDTFYYKLQSKLSKLHPDKNIEIGNFAIPGDSSEYGKLIFEKFAHQYHPDLVILGFGANDAKLTYVKHNSQVSSFKENSFFQNLRHYLIYSSLYRTLELVLKPAAKKDTTLKKVNAVTPREYVKNLQLMSDSAKNMNSDVLILNLCTPGNYSGSAKRLSVTNNLHYFNGQSYLVDQLEEIKQKKSYPEVVEKMEANYRTDLNTNETLYVTSDGCHPNQLGHLIISDKLSEIISPLVK